MKHLVMFVLLLGAASGAKAETYDIFAVTAGRVILTGTLNYNQIDPTLSSVTLNVNGAAPITLDYTSSTSVTLGYPSSPPIPMNSPDGTIPGVEYIYGGSLDLYTVFDPYSVGVLVNDACSSTGVILCSPYSSYDDDPFVFSQITTEPSSATLLGTALLGLMGMWSMGWLRHSPRDASLS